MDKDKIQEIADELAESIYGKDFYDLSGRQQSEIYNKAIRELDEMMAGEADMSRKDLAEGSGGYSSYLRAVKELNLKPIRIDEFESLQGALDMKDIIKLTERMNMVNKKVE